MASRWFLTIRSRVPRRAAIVLGLLPIIMLLGLWFFFTWGESVETRRINPTILPSPKEVVGGVPELLESRDLFRNTIVSLKRVGLGYLLALGIVLPLGIAMGSFGTVRATFSPMTTASGYIPIAALVPLTLSWFGTGELQKVTFLAMAFAIYLLPMIVRAIEAVPDVYLRTGYTLGASRAQVISRILIPIAMPDIWQGMRLAFGVGWTYLVLTEVVVMESGLGYLIQFSFRRGHPEHVYMIILVITLIAWIADLAWGWIGRLLFGYRSNSR